MNSLIGEKLSITTSKPQTTRKKILGILSSDQYQIIFLDTPGILNPEYLLQEKMLFNVQSAVKDADVVLLMIDASSDPDGKKTLLHPVVSNLVKDATTKKILIINKVDLSDQQSVSQMISSFNSSGYFIKVIPVSAEKKYNLESIIESILEFLPVHPKYYPDDDLSDSNQRFFVSEIIREKIFELFRDEIPYSTEVLIEEFIERPESKDFIRASIIVEKDSQKPIIIGDNGSSIKKLGKLARSAVEEFLGKGVFLELFVKVREKWRSNPALLKNFGYTENND